MSEDLSEALPSSNISPRNYDTDATEYDDIRFGGSLSGTSTPKKAARFDTPQDTDQAFFSDDEPDKYCAAGGGGLVKKKGSGSSRSRPTTPLSRSGPTTPLGSGYTSDASSRLDSRSGEPPSGPYDSESTDPRSLRSQTPDSRSPSTPVRGNSSRGQTPEGSTPREDSKRGQTPDSFASRGPTPEAALTRPGTPGAASGRQTPGDAAGRQTPRDAAGRQTPRDVGTPGDGSARTTPRGVETPGDGSARTSPRGVETPTDGSARTTPRGVVTPTDDSARGIPRGRTPDTLSSTEPTTDRSLSPPRTGTPGGTTARAVVQDNLINLDLDIEGSADIEIELTDPNKSSGSDYQNLDPKQMKDLLTVRITCFFICSTFCITLLLTEKR